jgi:hypothetical protein
MNLETLSPGGADPELLRVLTARHRAYLKESHPVMGPHLSNSLDRQTANGSLVAWLWKRSNGTAEGLVYVGSAVPPAKVHGLWLESTNAHTLEEILADLERELDSPLASVTDVIPKIGTKDQALVFGRRGFWHREKILMRRGPEKPADNRFTPSEVRTIRPADLETLVGVYVRPENSGRGDRRTTGPTLETTS